MALTEAGRQDQPPIISPQLQLPGREAGQVEMNAHAFLDELHFVFDLVPSDRLIAQAAREPRPGTAPGAVGLGARHRSALDALTSIISECSFHFGHGTEILACVKNPRQNQPIQAETPPLIGDGDADGRPIMQGRD